MTNKLRSRPPIASADDFIAAGAEQQTAAGEQPAQASAQTKRELKLRDTQGKGATPLPWEDPQVRDDVLKVYNLRLPEPYLLKLKHIEDPQVRDDVLKVYNLRLPEPYLLKLKHIAAHTPGSMHQFCIDVLLPEIDKKVKELA